MVPNGVLLDDPTIQSQVQQFLDYVLDHQDTTGWLGPEVNTTKPRYLWGRYPFFFGAIQMVEANPTLTDRVVSALHKFVALAHTMLHNGEGLEDWTRTRWEDFVIVLQWWVHLDMFAYSRWSLISSIVAVVGSTTSIPRETRIFLSTR